MQKSKIRPYAVLVSLIVSIGGLLLGMSSTIGGALEFFKLSFELTPLQEGLAVSAAMLGTFVGNFFVGNISDAIGRKKSLFLAAFLFSFLSLGSALSPNFSILMLTRLIGGLGIGISLLVAPMYIAEFSPSKHRGFLVSFNQLNVGIGFLLAAVSNSIVDAQVLDPDMKWRMMLAVPTLFPLLYMVLLLFVPESPRWLITQKRDEEATMIMLRAGGQEHVETEYQQIKNTLKKDANPDGHADSYADKWRMLFSKPMRRIVVIAFSIMMFQMLSGLNNVFFFGPKIFRMSGATEFMNPFMQANIIGVVMVLMTIVTMFVIDRLGRKPLLYIGVSLIAIASLMVGASFQSATYSIDLEDVDKIKTHLVESAIRAEGRKLNSNAYGISNIEIKGDEACLYKTDANGEAAPIVTVSMRSKTVQDAMHDATIVAEVLMPMKGVIYTSELSFFGDVKSGMEARSDELKGTKYLSIKDALLDAAIHVNSIWVLVGIILIVVGFSISLGPIAWAMLSEVFPSRIRGLGISVAGALNGITSYLVTTAFPLELEYLGSAMTYFIFGILMLICLAFVATIYPETKGKTLEEIEEELVKA